MKILIDTEVCFIEKIESEEYRDLEKVELILESNFRYEELALAETDLNNEKSKREFS
jgi:hypothetical protein